MEDSGMAQNKNKIINFDDARNAANNIVEAQKKMQEAGIQT